MPTIHTEDEIIAATVGDRQPVNSTIHLAPYNPAWPSFYAKLQARIGNALGDSVVVLEHVGSTSIPGLSAKPIIDMVLAVPDSTDEASYVAKLERKGFTLHIREPNWYEHRMFKSSGIEGNLHVFSAGCEEISRLVLFRNWLRDHSEEKAYYENTKRVLAARVWKYTQNYADAKSTVIQEILQRAEGD